MTANARQIPGDADATDRTSTDADETSVRSHAADRSRRPRDSTSEVPVDELLDLLADEYVVDIVRALDDRAMAAQELADSCDMSRPTVYRRLGRLVEAGLVESRTSLRANGRHRQRFHLLFEEAEVHVGADGIVGDVETATTVGD